MPTRSSILTTQATGPHPCARGAFPAAEQWLLLATALAACSRDAPPPTTPPPPELEAHLPELHREAAAEPPAPDAAAQADLRAAVELAFSTAAGDPRLAARSKRALLEGEGAGWALEDALAHAEPTVRSQAAFELGNRSAQHAILPLLLRLKYEADGTVLVWVAAALARLGNGAGLQHLIAAMDLETTARDAGLQAIEICRRAAIDPGDSPTYLQLQSWLRQLARRWQDTGALAGAEPATATPRTRARIAARLIALEGFQLRPVDDARFVLARAGTLAVPQLTAAARAAEPYLRIHALEILRELGPVGAPAAPAVLPLLADPASRVAAAAALGAMGARTAVATLRDWLASPDVELRAAAAGALGPIGDRSIEPLLRARMADPDEVMDVRVMAAYGLALLELERPAYRFLEERRTKGDYHRPTIDELLDRIDRAAAR